MTGVQTCALPIFSVAQTRKQGIVQGLVKGLTGLTKSKKVTYLLGTGAMRTAKTVDVALADGSSRTLEGRFVIIATGSTPRTIPGFAPGGPIMTSDEVLMLSSIPARIAVIGGGAIGCEFASTFADLGARVTILEGLPKILPGLDEDVANVVVKSFKKKNIDIRTGVSVTGHTPNASGGTTVSFGEGESIEVDAVVVSVGRKPYSDGLLLANAGVAVRERGFVEVDGYCQTTVPGVYAVGDIKIGRAHV